MAAYYNECNPEAAAWLRQLIRVGHIAHGIVDERSIEDVRPDELLEYTQCHFFAGIGGWSLALRLAGIPDDYPIWTGSCPCQPFSSAGAGAGFDDPRHLWPAFYKLIATCKPDIIFGEQVASSEVMGHADEGVYSVQGGQTIGSISSIYRARKIWCPPSVQDMPKGIRKEVALKFKRIQAEAEREAGGESEDLFSGVPRRKQGKISNLGMQASMFEEGDSVRSGSSSTRDSIKDRCRRLRSVGDSLGSDRLEGQAIQHPINRPDSSIQRICIQQHTDNSLCGERDDGRLGRGSDARDNAIVDSEEGLKNDERRASRENNKKPYGQIKPSWIDAVFDDLEGSGYACAAVAFPASCVGAPHIRDRAYWVGHSISQGLEGYTGHGNGATGRTQQDRSATETSGDGGVDNATGSRHQRPEQKPESKTRHEARLCVFGAGHGQAELGPTGPTNGQWGAADWLLCRDGKWRPVEPGTFPLVDGISRGVVQSGDISLPTAEGRAMRLKGYGNAIVPQQAAEFIRCAIGVAP